MPITEHYIQDRDYVRFATFLRHQATDDKYDASFRARFDSERERSPEQVQIVQSIWRINTLNRQLVDVVLARLEQALPDAAVTKLFNDVAKHGLFSFNTLDQPNKCDITGQVVDFGRRLLIKPPSQEEEPRVWTIRSDFMRIVRFFNVLSHFVDCTTARFQSEPHSDVILEEHYRDWQCCRRWITTLTEAIAALPSSETPQSKSTTPPAPKSSSLRQHEAMNVDT